jgi:hypothetical protein
MPEEKIAPENAPAVQARMVPINWAIPAGITTVYANNMVVHYGEHDCYLLFFEGIPPLVFGLTPEQQAEFFNKIDSVTVNCVARVAVPKNLMPAIIKVLQEPSLTALQAQPVDKEVTK